MIDRSVISKKHPDAQSPTKEQITTLKMKVVQSESRPRPLGSKISSIVQHLLHYCTVSSASTKNRTCEFYGHRLGPRGKDDHHLCADCRAVIKGPEDLRKASPVSSLTKEVGDGSWRSAPTRKR
ncbi:MAG: hypothetical protein SGJ27_11215 [Candidatus Melainabacteria bacterium]|nr:hypothetical protein [Candidatus Melainabacteria bacterium]